MIQRMKGEVEYPEDMKDFLDFEQSWQNNTLTNDHVVMVKVRRWAESIAYDFNKPARARDLEQDCLMALITSGYSGWASLDTYIVKILLRKNIAAWRKDGAKRQAEMPVEIEAEAGSEFSEAVIARLSSDKLVKELLMTNELIATVVRILIEVEHSVGRKRIAELASVRLGRKVTRYQVEVALEQLRDRLQRRKMGFSY